MQRLSETQLDIAEYACRALDKHPAGLTPTEIATATGYSATAITFVLEWLTGHGHVDRRGQRYVVVTPPAPHGGWYAK